MSEGSSGAGTKQLDNSDTDLASITVTGATTVGDIAAARGSAALASYHFVGDDGTGLWSPGPAALAASTAGVERARVTATGLGLGISPAVQLHLSTDGARKLTSSTWATGSDERIKANIEYADLGACYDTVKRIPLKRYEWRAEYAPLDVQEDRRQLGWIAQDVETVLPKAVSRSAEHGFQDFRSLQSDQLIKTLYGAVQKLIADKEALEARVDALA